MTPSSVAPLSSPLLDPRSSPDRWSTVLADTRTVDADDISSVLSWLVRVGHDAPEPGGGRTADLWNLLAGVAAVDVGLARMLEPHLDARSILAQAHVDEADLADRLADVQVDDGSSWGVFAAEGSGLRLDARLSADGWRLAGRKPWCSLAGTLSHALVTAWVSPTERGLFAVDLRAGGVDAHPGPWVARGLPRVVSAPVDFSDVRAVPVGAPGWYLSRPGFALGGMGVAAVWWGAAVPLAAAIVDAARRAGADQLAESYAGRADAELWSARAVLAEAADAADHRVSNADADADAKRFAGRVRGVVADAVERVMTLADHALGPAPLTVDEGYARRVADLHLYLRQHHAERDAARLGRLLVGR